MKLRFIGTGAADWDIAHPSSDINFRRCSSCLINDELLIDPGPCVYEFCDTFGLPDLTGKVKYIVATHFHGDHISADTAKRLMSEGARWIVTECPVPVKFGRYTVTAVPANHNARFSTHLIVSDGESELLYALDGGWMTWREWEEIKKHHFGAMVFDGTMGNVRGNWRMFTHNDFHMVAEMKKYLGEFTDRTIVSHVAKCAGEDHEAQARSLEPYGIELAYDGWVTEI